MQTEIDNAASFWAKYLPDAAVPSSAKEGFRNALVEVLRERYAGHWNSEKTQLGSGYRAISNWRRLDQVLVAAAQRSGVGVEVAERYMPRDVVLWCDPYNVTYRVGDHGTVYTVYEDKKGLIESVKRTMAERVSKSNGDFVISAYTTPVVIRSADGVEIARRGGAASASPTKAMPEPAVRRVSVASPLRRAATLGASGGSPSPPGLLNSAEWPTAAAAAARGQAKRAEDASSSGGSELTTPPPQFALSHGGAKDGGARNEAPHPVAAAAAAARISLTH